ncbi:hypothetical protein AXX17_AT5G17730 [Arabidopsis thaliana]|uniref:Uncharacterized protein n=1 Tax=Arabidopsis thaliana TaxID=3702 RepID=A0A178UKB9_ARATH|nr:hypothetical protein AXX17_AT5G17730 [Arabidopsis thaliana]
MVARLTPDQKGLKKVKGCLRSAMDSKKEKTGGIIGIFLTQNAASLARSFYAMLCILI